MNKTKNGKKGNFRSSLPGLFMLTAIAVMLWLMLSSWEKEVTAALIVGVTSVGALIATRINEKKKEYEQALRERKTPLYEEFMTLALRQLMADDPKEPKPTTEEMARFFRNWLPKFVIWGSDEVVKEVVQWKRDRAMHQNKSGVESLLEAERLLLAIRADLGHTNKGLKEKDLLSLFVTDIDELPPSRVSVASSTKQNQIKRPPAA